VTPRTIYPIRKLVPDSDGTRVTIGIGKNQGVNETWKAYLVDREGLAIRRGELKIVAIDATTTTATSKRSPDDLPKDAQVHIDSR
jgi:hypothetical protein